MIKTESMRQNNSLVVSWKDMPQRKQIPIQPLKDVNQLIQIDLVSICLICCKLIKNMISSLIIHHIILPPSPFYCRVATPSWHASGQIAACQMIAEQSYVITQTLHEDTDRKQTRAPGHCLLCLTICLLLQFSGSKLIKQLGNVMETFRSTE